MNKKKWIYIGILIVVIAIVSIASFSYAFLTKVDEQHGKINIVAGTLDYRIESSDLNSSNSITVTGTKIIDIKLTSLNEISSKYELYYTSTNNNVVVEYVDSNEKDESVGTINAYSTKNIQVRITSTNAATVVFGVKGGFVYNELTLGTNENSLTGVEIVLPPTITGGSNNLVAVPTTITISEAGYASKGIDYYEYYKSTSSTSPTSSTTATGTLTTSPYSLTVSDEGTTYVYYRTVATTGNKSNWTSPQVVKLDPYHYYYEELDYLGSSGTQYINTGVNPSNTNDIEITFKTDYNHVTQESIDNGGHNLLFGSYNNTINKVFGFNFGSGATNTRFYLWKNNTYENGARVIDASTNTYNPLNIVTIKNINDEWFVNGTSIGTAESVGNWKDTNQTIILFGGYYSGSINPFFDPLYVYSCKIWDNGTLIRDLVPSKRKSDNKPGLYDKVNKVFYTNAGTGEFVMPGQTDFEVNYSQINYIKSNGTQYINTKVNPANTVDFELKFKTDYNHRSQESRDAGGLEDFFGYINYTTNKVYAVNFGGGVSQTSIFIWKNNTYENGASVIYFNTNTYNPTTDIITLKNVNNVWTVNGNTIGTAASVGDWRDTSGSLVIGGDNIDGVTKVFYDPLYVYGAKFWDNGTLIRDLVPCKRKSDNKPGLYDKVNKVFYTNAGTGEFITP